MSTAHASPRSTAAEAPVIPPILEDLPTTELTAILASGVTLRINGYRGKTSPESRCLEALPLVTHATQHFCAVAEGALETWAPFLGAAIVATRLEQIARLRNDLLPDEQPYYLVGLNDGSRYVAYDDGVLLVRHANGQQEDRQYTDRGAAAQAVSRLSMRAAGADQARRGA